MREQVRSGLIAGLISAVIWMMITVMVGMDKAAIVGGGVLFLVGTTLVTVAISSIISRGVTARAS
ncbi:MAG: hypothetical protein ABIR75_07565 [Arachnia sp.]